MPYIGYTRREAKAIKKRIDRRVAAIEQAMDDLLGEVTDHGFGLDWYKDEIQQTADRMKDIVDRRTPMS